MQRIFERLQNQLSGENKSDRYAKGNHTPCDHRTTKWMEAASEVDLQVFSTLVSRIRTAFGLVPAMSDYGFNLTERLSMIVCLF